MTSTGVRLRQAVIAAADLDAVAGALREELGLGAPYADPGVALFGLRNAVFALGDTFLEVISPTRPHTAAGRWLERNGGDGGYMLILQFADLVGARARADALGARVVWQLDLPDISGTHLHPADTRGALLSLDRADPPGSWRWGGPDWTGGVGTGAPGRLDGVTVSTAEPIVTARRWGTIAGVEPGPGPALALDGGHIAFTDGPERVARFDVRVPDDVRRGRETVAIGGVMFALRALSAGSAPTDT